ncbi:hypothetical protein TWF718_008704 [Orbilia javanica]|uniref:Uncharacterized protein n=1 Tax=Orbilia javanica TaxID=47235 RepID=A0AAN8MQS8_9PEZI
MPPPTTPRYRFPSPDDVPRSRTDPPRVPPTTVQAAATAAAPSPAPKPPAQFATPAPLTARRHLPQPTFTNTTSTQTPRIHGRGYNNRGFSPDPDFFTPGGGGGGGGGGSGSKGGRVVKAGVRGGIATVGGSGKRRRSFDLDEIDEALVGSSGRPRVLGASGGGWKVPAEYLGGTPVGRRIQGINATPTPSARRPTFRQGSAIISSPPEGLNLSFGDTQEDVQDDDDEEDHDQGPGNRKVVGKMVVMVPPQKKRQKSVGVFDDIESIASSLPGGDDGDGSGEGGDIGGNGDNRKENGLRSTTMSSLRTPPRVQKGGGGGISNPPESSIRPTAGTAAAAGGGGKERWMAVPDQPQLKLPPKSSPTSKLNKAICAMAWSPSHRKRRNLSNKYLNGGLAATVLGWAYDAQDAVLRSNMVIEQNLRERVYNNNNDNGNDNGNDNTGSNGNYGDWGFVIRVEGICAEEGYAAVTRAEEGEEIGSGAKEKGNVPARVILIGDENSGLRRDLRQGSRVEVRPPMWEVAVEGKIWTVGINWRLL